MSNLTTIQGGDLISNSRADINSNFTKLNNEKIETSYISTDNTLGGTSASDDKLSTQKAVREFVVATASPTGRSWNEYAIANSGTDAYTISVPGVTALVTGMTFKFKADVANTGACTLNVNGLGAKAIKKEVTNDLATNDILAGQALILTYDGTNMQLETFVPSQSPTSIPITASAGQATYTWNRNSHPTLTIAHGLGVVPTMVRLTAVYSAPSQLGSSNTGMSGLTYLNGTNYGYSSLTGRPGSVSNEYAQWQSNSMVIRQGGNTQHAEITGTITTLNSTNIVITFVGSGDEDNLWDTNQTATITWEAIK